MIARNALFLFIFLFTTACGGSLIQSTQEIPSPPENRGYLQIICQPQDAEIYVDGIFKGYLDGYIDGVLLLPAGHHRLSVQKYGYYSQYGEVDLGEEAVTLQWTLVPQPQL